MIPNEDYPKIKLRDGPSHCYFRPSIGFPVELPFRDGQLWLAKCQMSLIYEVTEKKVIQTTDKILALLLQTESDYCTYFPVRKYGDKIFQYKFYRIDLVLTVGRALGTRGYCNFRDWTHLKFGI